jgi:hypothetical protein
MELLEYLSEEYCCDISPQIFDETDVPDEYNGILRPGSYYEQGRRINDALTLRLHVGMTYEDAEKIRTALYQARMAAQSTLQFTY